MQIQLLPSQLNSIKTMEENGDTPFLPEEIITNILKRLPVKSLIRFQSVCKHWKNLIKTPSFIADHFHHSRDENPLVLLQWDARCDPLYLQMLDYDLQVLEVQPTPLIDSLSRATIVGSGNGLLCVENYNDDNISPPSFLLWNPAIRQVRQVPINDIHHYVYVGFGFSPVVNDCKILISKKLEIDDVHNQIEVFSLNTGSWKEIKVENIGGVCLSYDTVTANGAMFWSGSKCTGEDEHNKVIVSFDLGMEAFTLIPMPAFDSDSYRGLTLYSYQRLTVYENKLAMFSHTVIGNYESGLIDLWVMEESTGASRERFSWSKKYSIICSGSMFPFSIWGNEIVCNVNCDPGWPGWSPETEGEANNEMMTVLCLFDLTTHELEAVQIPICGSLLDIFYNYAESLVSFGNVHVEEP